MKSPKAILWIAIAVCALFTQAVAQTEAARVSVPFKFSLANRTLPAGDYRVTINGSLLQIAAIDSNASATAMTVYAGGGHDQDLTPRLVFHRYGDHRFLAEVWIGEINMGHQLFASAGELEYARNTKQESVTDAMARTPR